MSRSRLAALLLLAAVAVAPAAATAQEVDGRHGNFRGVHAVFTATDPSGCVVTTAPIQASVSRGQASGAFLDIDNLGVYDACAGESLLTAYFSATALVLDVGPRLEWATLRGATTADYCWGPRCPAGPFSLTIDLTWTASGPPARDHFQYHLNVDGEIRTGAGNGVARPAVASGTLTDGTTNYALNPSAAAGISAGDSSSTWVTPPG